MKEHVDLLFNYILELKQNSYELLHEKWYLLRMLNSIENFLFNPPSRISIFFLIFLCLEPYLRCLED